MGQDLRHWQYGAVMTYTSLHRALGLPAGPVTEEMIAAAVIAQVAEAEDLDWKATVDEVKDGREFAKDVAAMANTAGGVIVFGVREDGHDQADELVGIADPRPLVQSLRGKAGMVRPFIPALRVRSVPLVSKPGRHLIVVEVPRSPEAPHLVPLAKDLKDSWGYPRRRGSDTDWLGESDLAVAYADRFSRRRAAEDHLTTLSTHLSERLLHLPSSIWVAVTTACSVPSVADTANAVDPNTVEPSLQEALPLLPEAVVREYLDGGTGRPRIGLRRAVVSTDITYTGQSRRGHLELLHDGAFAGALNMAHLDETVNGLRYLVQVRLQRAVRDMVTVAALHAQRRQADGVLEARVGIAVPGPETVGHAPAVALTHQRYMMGDPQPVSGSITLATVLPVMSEAPLADLVSSEESRRQFIEQLTLDLVHQFAVASLVPGS
ncbi:hypothetical protein BIV23_00825 [Streptomyces monashensis]|uniref:Schlafen AlbA-2 domain-containing protein n=2 Tax=Streptomyces monashensis TaxID=1678012 RepID=A0A1S2QQX9_9ACTN|nr:hypothetical protein BIV23_00825 [Streptomyces monashensis]